MGLAWIYLYIPLRQIYLFSLPNIVLQCNNKLKEKPPRLQICFSLLLPLMQAERTATTFTMAFISRLCELFTEMESRVELTPTKGSKRVQVTF